MTGRQHLRQVLDSAPYKLWAVQHPTDARKIQAEFDGQQRPQPASLYARGLVGLCRAHPPVAAPPPTVATLLAQPGALLRTPSGLVEDMARFKAAGGRWVAANVGDHTTMEWQNVRYRATQAGVPFGYWKRCCTEQDIRNLLAWSVGMELALINVEQPEIESTLTPDKVAAAIRSAGGGVTNIGTVLMGWIGFVTADGTHHGPDYTHLAPWPGLLEVFPTDMHTKPYAAWTECREHALKLGLTKPVQLAQTYDGAQPSWYTPPYSIYTLDDCATNIEQWL